MAMLLKIGAVLFLGVGIFVHSIPALSTTRSTRPLVQINPVHAFCEIQARFLSVTHEQKNVYWILSIKTAHSVNGGVCPDKDTVSLLIWGAEFHNSRAIYPEYIEEPKEGSEVFAHIQKRKLKDTAPFAAQGEKKEFNDWMVTNWREGFETR